MINFLCPLCNSDSQPFYKEDYYCCNNCKGIFVPQFKYLNAENEKARYEEHNNDENDPAYQKFVSPITQGVFNSFSKNHQGLDFGSGKSSSISKVLRDQNYNIEKYDPFFYNFPNLLKSKYDYIAACEVIEHFNTPKKEFKLLFDLLNKNGVLYCMTSIYNKSIDFSSWYYKRDPTHVFIYQAETIFWIQKAFQFRKVLIEDRLIQFFK
jgi:hypothetical protein